MLRQSGQHGINNLRQHRRAGIVVEINRVLPGCHQGAGLGKGAYMLHQVLRYPHQSERQQSLIPICLLKKKPPQPEL